MILGVRGQAYPGMLKEAIKTQQRSTQLRLVVTNFEHVPSPNVQI